MKKLGLILCFLIGSIASASATCTGPAVMHDFPGTSFNMSLATNAGDGNCASNVAVPDGGDVTLGAKADAKNAATDTTPITAMSVWKQISASIQAAASSLASLVTGQSTGNTSLATIATNTGAAIPAGTALIGYTSSDPCNNASAKVYTPINTVTANNTIIAGVSAKKKYICSIFVYPGATVNFAVYQATTGTSCATALADIFGGHTTGTGFIATAQAGFSVGNGNAAIAATNTVNTDICITNGGTVQLSGSIVTVDQ